MKVILKETINSLGIIGSEVKVAAGYARNYLLPQQKAVQATPENRRKMEHDKIKFDLQIAKEKEQAEQMARAIEGISCKISAKVSEENKLYGSVNVRDIVNALAAQNVQIEKRMILLSDPIKTIGTFQVPIRIYSGVEPEITVEVVPE